MKPLPLALSLTFLLGLLSLPGRAQPPLPVRQAGVPVAQVVFLPLPGLALVEKDTYRYDAGTVDTVRTPHLDRSFALKNTTRQPITITGLRGSCGCETLLLLQGGAPKPTARLAPGEQATIHLLINLHAGQPGAVRKYVWVDGLAAASGQALATLEVDILLRQSISFIPSFIDFGKVEAGAGAWQDVTVSLDPDLFPTLLVPSSSSPRLGSAAPEIQARPFGPVRSVMEGGRPRLHQIYHVTLSPSAHAGRLTGQLWLDLPQTAVGNTTSPSDSAPISKISLAVTGQVAGAIDALPASVFFGSLPAGKPVTRSVILSLASSTRRSLIVTSSAPWLHAFLDQSAASGKHYLLSLTLTAQTPAGPVQGKVTVALSDGERLDIPVIAEMIR